MQTNDGAIKLNTSLGLGIINVILTVNDSGNGNKVMGLYRNENDHTVAW